MEAIKRLQAEYDRIQSRIQAMYVDKLDAKVDPGMFERLSADWRKQQDRCLREIERRQSADQHYLEEGVTILEMARNAQRLFDSEEPMQKRRLLNFVVSNSTWANGELEANLREPFGFIAVMARFTSGGGSSNGANFADHSDWLGLLNTYRTLCIDPPPGIRLTFEQFRTSLLGSVTILPVPN